MNELSRSNLYELESYRLTAQAIGLVELFGNIEPNNKQVRMAEKLISTLGLSWEACEDISELMRSLKK